MAIVYTDDTHYKNIAKSIRSKNGSNEEYLPEEMSRAIDKLSISIEGGFSTSDANATSEDIKLGQIAYNSDGRVEGTMPDNGTVNKTLLAGEKYSIAKGYHSGAGNVQAASLSSQTSGNATKDDIALNKTAWVNGSKVTGSFTIDDELNTQETLINDIITALDNKLLDGDVEYTPILQDKTVTPSTIQQIVTSDEGYDGLGTVTVKAMTKVNQAEIKLSVNNSGRIQASATQSAGYVSSGTKTSSYQLYTQAAKTITPTTSEQIAVDSNRFTTGAIKVAPIPEEFKIPVTQSITITESGTYTPPDGVDGYSPVIVEVQGQEPPSIQSINITKSGTYEAPTGVDGYSPVVVNIPDPVMQSKTISPSVSQQTVVPDNGYDGLSSVVVNAMQTTTQVEPTISVSSSGLITAQASQSEGYVSAGTKSATKQLTTQGTKTIIPSTSSQVAVSSGTYVTGEVSVSGDTNLKSENIKKGISIFGVAGSCAVGSTSDIAQYKTLRLTADYNDGSIVDGGSLDGQTCPAIHLNANMSGKTIHGIKLNAICYDYESDADVAYAITYFNPTAADGDEIITAAKFYLSTVDIETYENRFLKKTDIGGLFAKSNNYIRIKIAPFDLYDPEEYAMNEIYELIDCDVVILYL